MKIVFVTNALKVSGAEEHLLDLAKGMLAYGIEPVFMVRKGGIFQERLTGKGYICHPVFSGRRILDIFVILKTLLLEQPDAISVNREHNIYTIMIAYFLALPFLKKKPKLVNVFHTPTSRRYPLLAEVFDGVIATSEYTGASFCSKNPGIKTKMQVIHYGVKIPPPFVDKSDPYRKRKYFHERSFPIIGMVGELWKNQEELVAAGAILRDEFPNITIAIVGGGSEQDNLKQLVKAHGLEGTVVLTGRIPRCQVYDVFYDLDISVSTHKNEGFGIVHIESLVLGTPVVAYNCGGLVEILRGGGGVLIDGGVPEFCKAIIDLIRNKERYSACVVEGRRNVEENFSIDKMVINHVNYYRKITGMVGG